MEAELVALFGGGLAGQWLTKIVGPTLEDFSHDLRDWVQRKRGKNLQAIVVEAVRITEGKEIHAVPGRTYLPLLTAASCEDDPDLQKLWAALLASAALNPDMIPPAYPKMLSELSPLDARILEYLFQETIKTGRHPTIIECMTVLEALNITLPASFLVPNGGGLIFDEFPFGAAAQNLGRLQLVVTGLAEHYGLNVQFLKLETLYLTASGFAFARACHPPQGIRC